MKSKPEEEEAAEAAGRVGELGDMGGRSGSGWGTRIGATEVLSRTPPPPRLCSWLWWYMAAEMPLSWSRRTKPREVLVVRVASLRRQRQLETGIHAAAGCRTAEVSGKNHMVLVGGV